MGDLPDLLRDRFGENFHFGGLAGIPFTGKTGFKAFAGHMPENGHMFIVVAPHIGVTPDGELGKYQRCNQSAPTTACGACVGAWKLACEDGPKPSPPVSSPEYHEDYQFRLIQTLITDHMEVPAARALLHA